MNGAVPVGALVPVTTLPLSLTPAPTRCGCPRQRVCIERVCMGGGSQQELKTGDDGGWLAVVLTGAAGRGARGRRIRAPNMVTSRWTWWRTSLDVHTARKGGAGGSWLRGESRRRWQRWAGRSAPSGTAGTGWGGSTLCMYKCGSPVWRMVVLERRSGECSERGRTLRWPFREQRRFGVGRARRVCHWAQCSGERWCGGPRPALPSMASSAMASRPEARGGEEEGAGSVAGRDGGGWSW